MSINGIGFIFFLLLTVVLYYNMPRSSRWLVLLIASAAFYLSYGVMLAGYLIGTILITYSFGLVLNRLAAFKSSAETKEEKQKQKKQNLHKKKMVLTAILLLDFGLIFVLKYMGFFTQLFNAVFRSDLPISGFLLPLGLSFFIFQTAGYLIDLYRGKYRAERNILRYTLFVCYFPQMLQGPINRYEALSPQLFKGNDFELTNIQHGFFLIIFGILKKALIADPLAPIVAEIYGGWGSYPGFIAFFGAALYCLQLYCDFSGGIDVVCGASRLYGIKMQENFCRPYFSTSLADFWRRWHISLGEWMKDYLFFPLALSKHFNKLSKLSRKYLPADIAKRITPCVATFIVFIVVGMWQGPGLANIAYGLWNGFWMSLGVLCVPFFVKLQERFPYQKYAVAMTIFGILRTNLLVIIGRYFSNAESLSSALAMLKHTFVSFDLSLVSIETFVNLGFTSSFTIPLLMALTALFFISFAQEKKIDLVETICSQKWYVQFSVIFVCLLLVVFCVYANSGYVPISYVYENV